MKLLPTRTSIGVKLALRYALTLFGVLVLFAAGVSSLVERRINREAMLVLEVQLADLSSSYQERARTLGEHELRAWLDRHATGLVGGADPTLGLGVEFLGPDGRRRLVHGSLARVPLPLDRRLLDGSRHQALQAANLGGENAYLCLSQRVQGGYLRVAIDTARFAKNAQDIRRIFLWSVPGVLVVAVIAGWMLARGALRPLAQINEAARRISADVKGRIPVTGTGDELDQLALTLNEMMGRIRAGVEGLRRFSENAAHELRSPLNRIGHHLDRLQHEPGLSREGAAALASASAEVERMAREIEAMLRLARIEEGLSEEQRRPVDLTAAVDHVASFFDAEAEEAGTRLEVATEPGLRVLGDPEWIQTALSNLVSNAIKYGGGRGTIRVQTRSEGRVIRIAVSDEGPGIPMEQLEEVFERFGRAGPTGQRPGFGLGLPIAREIAHAHGGRVDVTSGPRRGTTFTMTLPALD